MNYAKFEPIICHCTYNIRKSIKKQNYEETKKWMRKLQTMPVFKKILSKSKLFETLDEVINHNRRSLRIFARALKKFITIQLEIDANKSRKQIQFQVSKPSPQNPREIIESLKTGFS